jgi:surface polysaccharide O-acyltransferase-like enzyme
MAELTAKADSASAPADLARTRTAGRKVAIDYLRTFVIVLVLVHHSVLAYVTFGHFDPVHYLLSTAPIVDPRQWRPFDVIVAVNDIFFMSLMFFVSGVFVWPSLARKGAAHFLRDRFLRLGLPFAVVVTFLMPLAFYPSFHLTGANAGYLAFWRDSILVGPWPVGPPWFVSALLAFDILAALIYWAVPGVGAWIRSSASGVFGRPVVFALVLIAVSAGAYIPLLLKFGPAQWFALGPFIIQASRVLHYTAYFLAGVALGAYGLDRSAFVPGGSLARWWPLWMLAAVVESIGFLAAISQWPPPMLNYARLFVFACALLSMAWLAVFLRFVNRRYAILESLNDNSYGIYLIHYVFVVWLQYALLGTNLPAAAKGIVVFAGVLVLSWISVAALRRIPAIGKVV